MQLFDLCEHDGVELTLLSGNHDPFITDLRHLRLAGGQVFVTHGDALHPAVAPWSPAAARMRKAHAEALAAVEGESRDHLETMLAASQHASKAEWFELEEEASHSSIMAMLVRPWAWISVLRYWRLFPRLAAEFAQRHAPDSRFILIGHTHRAGIWEFDGRTVVNTGAFGFPGTPRAVRIEGQTMSVLRIRYDGATYRLAETIARYELEPVVESAAPSAVKTRPGSGLSKAAAM